MSRSMKPNVMQLVSEIRAQEPTAAEIEQGLGT